MSLPDLFTPVRLGAIDLANRIVMAPMTRSRAGTDTIPTPVMEQYYAQRAGAGLIISEATQISDDAQGYPNTPGVHTPAHAAAWRRVTDAVHARGGRIVVQLWHVGRISHPMFQPGGALPVAPSAIAAAGELYTGEGMKPFPTPRALETHEIPRLVAAFADAARRAVVEAGFDGVELHAANGYLIDQFLRDGTNHRTDAYGGSVENRARFLLEVTEAVSAAIGADRTGVRLSPNGTFNDMRDSNPAALFTHVVGALNRFGLAFLHVIEGLDGPMAPAPEVERLAPLLRRTFTGPFMINGGYDRATADRALADGSADVVSFGVPFIANPDLPTRLRDGTPLAQPDRATMYGGDERGYTDYPAAA
ncbi:alkene reductase [Azospirillum halopraeferens]|uniref:alkene reductase n=1 Tax=Azospirillum halopraeferens TaxID=34010 RepID=UPI0003FD2391|nr:alkene reductase [Azospirillum halopraeferens]